MTREDNELDAELIKRISKKDELALEELVSRYQGQIYNLAYRYTRSSTAAEELAQDVFLRVWQKAGSFKGRSTVFTWVYRITINLSLNRIGKKSIAAGSLDRPVMYEGEKMAMQAAAPEKEQPDSVFGQKEASRTISNAIDRLPSTQKMAFMLSKYENRPYVEIAVIMEASVPTVKSLLFRAKQNLRKYLLPFREKII